MASASSQSTFLRADSAESSPPPLPPRWGRKRGLGHPRAGREAGRPLASRCPAGYCWAAGGGWSCRAGRARTGVTVRAVAPPAPAPPCSGPAAGEGRAGMMDPSCSSWVGESFKPGPVTPQEALWGSLPANPGSRVGEGTARDSQRWSGVGSRAGLPLPFGHSPSASHTLEGEWSLLCGGRAAVNRRGARTAP